jgi:hypothetical protein|tara:strand:- start:6216 stop:6452 length:237 start_codon:yes stop_codon:yes gene_type:complete
MRSIKKPVTRGKRKNVAPQNPRFLPPAQMQGQGSMKKPKEKKERKPKVKNPGRGRGMATGGRRKLGRAVDASCRKPGC